jgi:hypothetical protein
MITYLYKEMFLKAKGMGMKKPAGMAGVWFWGYGLDYAAVKLWNR